MWSWRSRSFKGSVTAVIKGVGISMRKHQKNAVKSTTLLKGKVSSLPHMDILMWQGLIKCAKSGAKAKEEHLGGWREERWKKNCHINPDGSFNEENSLRCFPATNMEREIVLWCSENGAEIRELRVAPSLPPLPRAQQRAAAEPGLENEGRKGWSWEGVTGTASHGEV